MDNSRRLPVRQKDEGNIQTTRDPGKPVSRRRFLRLAGQGAALVAAGALGLTTWRAVDQGVFSTNTGPAYAAWSQWNTPGGENLDLVRAAILAANAHDSQPWRFRLSPTSIDLYADITRNLGTIDSLRREMYVSLGCALENLVIASKAKGLTPTLTLMPDPTDVTHAAHVDLSPGQATTSALYSAIPNRHTNRSPYDMGRVIPASTISALTGLNDESEVNLVWFTSSSDRSSFADLTVRATQAFIADAQQAADDYSWYRNDWHELQSQKDGITIDASGLPPLTAAVAKILGATRQLDDQGWFDNTRTQVATAGAFGVLATLDRQNNSQRIKAGRVWQRMHLWATTQGLAMQPLNQIVERVDREQSAGLTPDFTQAMASMMPSGWGAVMPFRIGYPTQTPLESPRRPAEEVVSYG